jgi:glutamate-1-semialdehyde 2,1-aminomutase
VEHTVNHADYSERLRRVIPGGAHTYSRGDDQYPSNAPQILARGEGVRVFDPAGRAYLDYGMALRAVNIGYAEPEIVAAAVQQIENGNNLTRPSLMVKFTKNGSTSVTAAVKLARAHTGRDLVARCAEHSFFSYDDWFIGSTPVTRGIPQDTIEKTKLFHYNDAASLKTLLEQYPAQFACVVLEPAVTEEPSDGFLRQVQDLCHAHGVMFVLDEMITGFRWHLKGAQHLYGVAPDLCTFGKAMANGFSVSCVAGRRELMQLGAIEPEGQERVFLLSTTHGAEMSSLGAFVATVRFMTREGVVEHLWDYGRRLINLMRGLADAHGVSASFKVDGVPCSPYYTTLDRSGANSLPLRTLFCQELVRAGVLMPWIALAYRHGDEELAVTEQAVDRALAVYRKALDNGLDRYLEGPAIRPVFRKYN